MNGTEYFLIDPANEIHFHARNPDSTVQQGDVPQQVRPLAGHGSPSNLGLSSLTLGGSPEFQPNAFPT